VGGGRREGGREEGEEGGERREKEEGGRREGGKEGGRKERGREGGRQRTVTNYNGPQDATAANVTTHTPSPVAGVGRTL